MGRGRLRGQRIARAAVAAAALVVLGACAAGPPRPESASPPAPPPTAAPPAPPPAAARPRPAPPPVAPAPLPEVFESQDYVVTFAKAGDTAETLAARFLGDGAKAWMVADYNGVSTFAAGQEVVIPRTPWNLSGVEPAGYQLVPVLVYHNIASQSRGRLVLGAKQFEDQMRYLKAEGYRVVSLGELLEYTSLKRQLPRKSVVLTFDDGWRSFKEFAYPLLKELGFPATLFIYTDFIGARSALTWAELRELAREGFDIHAHSKTHGDLRRRPGEADDEYARRIQVELSQPLQLFQRNLGQSSQILAYPYGAQDDDVLKRVKDQGYVAAFTVRRQGNPSFVAPLTIHRSQIYSEMTLEDFAKNLNVFNQEPIK
jgi:peptidoglycan/xylan/chitin deacetylase (PgdA/CDA1 family)